MIYLKRNSKRVIGYGAAAKGNTLLNYCGIGTDFIECVIDDDPHKQGKFLPGSRIPIKNSLDVPLDPSIYLLILPWNIKEDIIEKTKHTGCKYIIPIPKVSVHDNYRHSS